MKHQHLGCGLGSRAINLHSEGALRGTPIRMSSVEVAMIMARSGLPIIVSAAGSPDRVVVLSVEGLRQDALARLRKLADRPPTLALTPERLHHLGRSTVGYSAIFITWPEVTADFARSLADPLAEHVVDPVSLALSDPGPLRYHGEAALKLMKLAGLMPAVVIAHLRSGSAVEGWAASDATALVRAEDVLEYEHDAAATLRLVADARVPLVDAEPVRLVVFRSGAAGVEHLAIVVGTLEPRLPTLVRIHSSCFTGDVLGSLRCDCGQQLRGAIKHMMRECSGVLLYLAQEGRGIGLVNKLRAYTLQDQGSDTVDANELLGFGADERSYSAPAAMLEALGCARVRLLTNNPEKVRALEQHGIEVVERVSHAFPANGHNAAYLRTKALRSGHFLEALRELGHA